MKKYRVWLAVARGACLDIGIRVCRVVTALSRLDAAILAEKLVDDQLDDREYSHAQRVDWIPWGEAASLAVAA